MGILGKGDASEQHSIPSVPQECADAKSMPVSKENWWGIGLMLIGVALAVFVGKIVGAICGIIGVAIIGWAQYHKSADSWKWPILKLPLPAMRPKIIPVRWGRTPDRRAGLILRNDGEPGFDIVMDEPVQVGKAKLDFWQRTYAHLSTNDGELLVEACITLQNGSVTDASALRDLMVKEGIGSLSFAIRYRGLDKRPSFVTKFDVTCEVWGEGLRIANIHQERG